MEITHRPVYRDAMVFVLLCVASSAGVLLLAVLTEAAAELM